MDYFDYNSGRDKDTVEESPAKDTDKKPKKTKDLDVTVADIRRHLQNMNEKYQKK